MKLFMRWQWQWGRQEKRPAEGESPEIGRVPSPPPVVPVVPPGVGQYVVPPHGIYRREA